MQHEGYRRCYFKHVCTWRASSSGMAAALGKGAPVTFEYTGMRGSRNVTRLMACRTGPLHACHAATVLCDPC